VGSLAAGLVVAAVVISTGCVGSPAVIRAAPPPIFRGVVHVRPTPVAARVAAAAERAVSRPRTPPPDSASLVARSLREGGLRFGTDGSVGAILAYMRSRHDPAPLRQTRPGDVVFFRGDEGDCGAHMGIVVAVDPGGRVTFVESRAGRVRRSYLHPRRVLARRDEAGVLLNTFLRFKLIDDPPSTRYFAGDLLCAVYRPRAR